MLASMTTSQTLEPFDMHVDHIPSKSSTVPASKVTALLIMHCEVKDDMLRCCQSLRLCHQRLHGMASPPSVS